MVVDRNRLVAAMAMFAREGRYHCVIATSWSDSESPAPYNELNALM